MKVERKAMKTPDYIVLYNLLGNYKSNSDQRSQNVVT